MKIKLTKLTILALPLAFSFNTALAQWTNVGNNAGITSGQATNNTLAFGQNDTPYVSIMEEISGSWNASVMKFDGTDWQYVGSQGIASSTVNSVSMITSSNGVPYVAIAETANGNKGSVMMYNGSSWTNVGSAGITGVSTSKLMLERDKSNNLYLGFKENGNGNKLTVMKYNGTSWSTVGATGFTPAGAGEPDMKLDASGNPWVAFADSSNGDKVTVMMYNGTSWVKAGSTLTYGAEPKLAMDAHNRAFICYVDGDNNGKAAVLMYNGSSWVSLGTPNFTKYGIGGHGFTVSNNGVPFIAFANSDFGRDMSVATYNGTNWSLVGTDGTAGGLGYWADIKIDSKGNAYIAFDDKSGTYKTIVREYSSLVNVGIREDISSNTLSVYPNPAQQLVNVIVPQEMQGKNIVAEIVNVDGRTMKYEHLNLAGQIWQLPVSNLPNGYYMLKIQYAEGIYFQKIIKE